jgi:hypothetical protein
MPVPDSKERTVGLGPGVQFGGQGIWFRVNAYMEQMFAIVRAEPR